MKIACAHDAVYPFIKGGAEKRLHELSKRLARKGHEVHIFGVKWWKGEQTIERDGVLLHGVCAPAPLYVKGRRSIKAAVNFSRALLPHLLRERFDVIDCYQASYLHCYPAKIGALLKKSPLVITWHEVWRRYWYEYMGSLGLVGKALEKSILFTLPKRIIAVAEQTKNDLISLGVKKEKISVVPNGIDFDWISRVSPSPEKLDVVYVGRLIKPKNVDVLLRSIPFLKKEFPELRVGIIGDGPEKSSLEKLADELEVKKNVRFFGFIENFSDVIALEKSSKIFVIPSTQEGGSSIVTLEANACGLPVIAVSHKLGISPELITESNGLFVELSPKAIADKIRLLSKDTGLREGMGKNAISFARQHDWEKATDLIEKVYEEICR